MNTLDAFAKGEANRGKERMVFDWNKAAKIIKEAFADDNEIACGAGLRGDWVGTGGAIFMSGKPVDKDNTYTFLASTWATPELKVDGVSVDCYIMESETEWDEETYWPESALEILNS